jgi:hypothetical protein
VSPECSELRQGCQSLKRRSSVCPADRDRQRPYDKPAAEAEIGWNTGEKRIDIPSGLAVH